MALISNRNSLSPKKKAAINEQIKTAMFFSCQSSYKAYIGEHRICLCLFHMAVLFEKGFCDHYLSYKQS